MKVTIEIESDNPGFEKDLQAEMLKVCQQAADKAIRMMSRPWRPHEEANRWAKLRDSNGNTTGLVQVWAGREPIHNPVPIVTLLVRQCDPKGQWVEYDDELAFFEHERHLAEERARELTAGSKHFEWKVKPKEGRK